MLKNAFLWIFVLSFFVAGPTFAEKKAAGSGCKPDTVTGSYVRIWQLQDVDYQGNPIYRTYLFQLSLNSGGTASQEFTGAHDIMDTNGGDSSFIGSWECRKDGKLLVTMIDANYKPITTDPFLGTPVEDVELRTHRLTSYLFSVVDEDTLTTERIRSKIFDMSENPMDPAQGILNPESFAVRVYNRLKPSDADFTP